MDYSDSGNMMQNVRTGPLSTEYATGAIVIAALVALILIRRGFRGVSIPGVGGASIG